MSGIPIKRKLAVLWPYLALLALALTASGFWYLGAAKIKKSLYESPNISFNNISVRGFPSQFRLILENYSIQLPQGNLSGKKLTAVRMFYDFNHTIIWAEGSLQFQGKSGDQLTLTGDTISNNLDFFEFRPKHGIPCTGADPSHKTRSYYPQMSH